MESLLGVFNSMRLITGQLTIDTNVDAAPPVLHPGKGKN